MTPHIAIIDTNILSAIGLKSILQSVMPMMHADIFGSLLELKSSHTEQFVHFFVSIDIMLKDREWFEGQRARTIVLTPSVHADLHGIKFHSLCVNQSESQLIKSLLRLEQMAHGGGRHLPPISHPAPILSSREIEVMSLIVKGMINKEIADRLNIGLTTVVTHRKNIMDKLSIKSVSQLTIYAVMHGYVSINDI